jgi:peptidoglycan/xylan/chitin deacetylase (PgdA/CDA1 family)
MREILMWRVGGIVAVLAILGLSAGGLVAAQKITVVSSSSSPETSASPDPATTQATPAALRRAEPQKAAAAPETPAPDASGQQSAQDRPVAPCDKPGAMGLGRTVEIDTTGGPGFGEPFKQYDFLRYKEVILTFDDGPSLANTPAVVKALSDECLKATFFEVGEPSTWHPEITKLALDSGMTVGTHTWSHKDLARNPYAKDIERAKTEIEMGVSALQIAAAGSTGKIAPFFRFPYLQQTPQLLSYLGERNIAVFSADIDSRDFKLHKPEDVIKSVMTQLERRGRGIVLLHDLHHNTAEAVPELIHQLKDGGYKIVHLVPKGELTSLPKFDDMVRQKAKLSSNDSRPAGGVVRTIGN